MPALEKGMINMIRALIIKANGEYFVRDIVKGYKAVNEIVCGDSEYVTLTTGLSLACNEMGKANHLPVNERATAVYKAYLNTCDWIAGDAVIYGLDAMGDSCSLSEDQISEIEKTMEG